MNYGKSAYIKVIELEQRLSGLGNSQNSFDSYLEISKPNINGSFSKDYDLTIEFPRFEAKEGKNLCFQICASLSCVKSSDIEIELLVNGSIISTETRTLSSQGDIIVFKTFTPIADGDIALTINFKTKADSVITLKNISAVVLGASGENISTDIELRAIKNGDHILVSYVDDGKLYEALVPSIATSLRNEDFSFVNTAISHCYAFSSFDSRAEINLFRVDLNHNLYLSKRGEPTSTLIASDVAKVFACPCPKVGDYLCIVVYVKTDGHCYYRMIDNNRVTNETAFNFPVGKYVDIMAVSQPDCEYLYVVASHENGSNYICKSLVDVATGKIVETLKLNYLVTISKYIDVSFSKNIENISMDVICSVASINVLADALQRCSFASLSVQMSLKEEKYKFVVPITYGVEIDTAKYLEPDNWVTYCDDNINFEPAYFDHENKVFVDNGWMDRWPLNEVRPCLVKDGKVVGYLQKDNYALFEDGTPCDITSSSAGDVMVEFPKIYHKISRSEDGIIKLNISNYEQEGYNVDAFVYRGVEHEKIYVAAYLCTEQKYSTKGIHSNSGTQFLTSTNTSYALTERAFLTNRDPNIYIYSMPYHFVNMLSCWFTILFKTTDTYERFGVGAKTTNDSGITGVYDDKGLFYGELTAPSYPKVFGLESLYGVKETIILGIWRDQDNKLHLADPKNNTNLTYNSDDLMDYPVLEGDYVPSAGSCRIPLDINGSNETGFFHLDLPSKSSSIYPRGFCCGNGQKSGDTRGFMIYGCDLTFHKYSGMYSGFLLPYSGEARPSLNSRLVLYPQNE